jgi:hypothetical protein
VSQAEILLMTFTQKYWTILALLAGVSFSFHNVFFLSQVGAHKELGPFMLLPYWIGELPIVAIVLAMKTF